MRRVISLLPSCTEIVCALGEEPSLVGRSHACDFPASVQGLPACTQVTIDPDAPSGEIERQIKGLSAQALSPVRIDLALMQRLKPDLIFAQDQGESWPVNRHGLEPSITRWPGTPPLIVSVAPVTLPEVWESMLKISEALQIPERGRSMVKELKNQVVNVIAKACMIRRRPSVICLEWLDPLLAAGNWIPDLVELAGGLGLLGESGKRPAALDWKAIVAHDPAVILVLACGFDLYRTRRELNLLSSRPEWKRLRAVKNRRVFLLDGRSYFNRPAPRLVESLESLAEILHPKLFHFGWETRIWERL